MSEFGDIWKSYIKGEPLSKLVTESHHAEGDDENEDINEEEYEYVYIDEDGNEIDNYQESDDAEDEDLEVAEESDDEDKPDNDNSSGDKDDEHQGGDEVLEVAEESEDTQELEVAEEQTFEPCDHCKQPDTCREAGECLGGESTSEASTPETQDLHENLRLLQQENARLKEDLTFVVRKLRNAGLLED